MRKQQTILKIYCQPTVPVKGGTLSSACPLKVELMHECCPQHLHLRTTTKKVNKEADRREDGIRKQSQNKEMTMAQL